MATPAFVQPSMMSRAKTWAKAVIESALDWVFSLTHSAGLYRDTVRWAAFALIYLFSVASLYDLNGWSNLLASLVPPGAAQNPSILVIQLGVFVFQSFLHPEVLRRVIAIVAPYLLIHRFAAVYLADIFEKDTEVATRFIKQAAFAEDYLTIRIRAGKLIESDEGSPIVQIGGPGYVTVELDSAAVFERPDGTVRVIGPTAKLPRGRAVIDDFERLRRCIDLRDVIDKHEITARSKDGIIVKARDIQFSYSVYRGENPKKSLDLPYPFDEDALKRMVKGAVTPVFLDKLSKKDPEWKNPLPGPLGVSINMEFSAFVSRRGLSEFFSSIGSPEEESLRQREEQIHKDAQALAGHEGFNINESPLKSVPFTSRPGLAEFLFGSDGFKNAMKNAKGLQVNWIGVGTWETPSEIIPTNHLEAWKTSQENRRLGGAEQLNRLYNDTRTATIIRLINELPIYTYTRLYNDLETRKRTEPEVLDMLFKEYIEFLRGISKYFEEHQQKIPENIVTALESVNRLIYHEVGTDYYACIKSTSRPDINIKGALVYTLDVAFSVHPLPGFESRPVIFDFGNWPQLDFIFLVNAPNATVNPPVPQSCSMKRDDLYVRTQFQAIILPGTSTDTDVYIQQNGLNLDHFIVPLIA